MDVIGNVVAQELLQFLQVRATGVQDFGNIGVGQQRQQQVFYGQQLVSLAARSEEGGVQRFLQFVRQHGWLR